MYKGRSGHLAFADPNHPSLGVVNLTEKAISEFDSYNDEFDNSKHYEEWKAGQRELLTDPIYPLSGTTLEKLTNYGFVPFKSHVGAHIPSHYTDVTDSKFNVSMSQEIEVGYQAPYILTPEEREMYQAAYDKKTEVEDRNPPRILAIDQIKKNLGAVPDNS